MHEFVIANCTRNFPVGFVLAAHAPSTENEMNWDSVPHTIEVEPMLHKRRLQPQAIIPIGKLFIIDFLALQSPVSVCLSIVCKSTHHRAHTTTLSEMWFLFAHFSLLLVLFRIVFVVRSVAVSQSVYKFELEWDKFLAFCKIFIYTSIWIAIALTFPLRFVTNFYLHMSTCQICPTNRKWL